MENVSAEVGHDEQAKQLPATEGASKLNEEEDDDGSGSSSEAESSDDDDVDVGDVRIDVRTLRNLSLEEVKARLKAESAVSGGEGENAANKKKVDQPITKVIVRRLPPEMTVQSYLDELREIPNYNYIRLVPQHEDFPSRVGKRNSIYINFDTEEEAFWFKEKYNNTTFYDEFGNDYISCVDFSLVQELGQDPEEENPQTETLEDSEVYKEFMETFEKDPYAYYMVRPDTIPTPEDMLQEILNKNFEEQENTPLLQFLRRRTEKEETDRKERELKRRERESARRKQREESNKRKQKEKEDASKKKPRERDDAAKRDKERERNKESRKERDRERQRERDRQRRLRREQDRAAAAERPKHEGSIGAGEKTGTDKDRQSKEESKRSESEKDSKGKSYSGTITYSKSGNPTRWSENSGPRKNDKRNKTDSSRKSQEQIPGEPSSEPKSQKLEAKAEDSEVKKSPFGKPFPMKEKESMPSKSTEDKNKKESTERGGSTNDDNKPKESSGVANSETGGSTTKKKIVKKVIRVKKVSKEKEDGSNDPENSESRPKKVMRVVKKTSKGEEGASGSKPESSGASKNDPEGSSKRSFGGSEDNKPNQDKGTEPEKERKNRRGRPEIQIYRPGSLRGAASTKQSTSKGSSAGDKERSGDNGNT